MKQILLLALIVTIAVLIIASIVIYQFYQQQTAISNISKIIEESTPTKTDTDIAAIDKLNECLKVSFEYC